MNNEYIKANNNLKNDIIKEQPKREVKPENKKIIKRKS